jgi:general stress protein YciG
MRKAKVDPVKAYLSEIGRKGGAKSKRKITPDQQKAMQDAKRARRGKV